MGATPPPSRPSRGVPCRLRVSLEQDGPSHSVLGADEFLPDKEESPAGFFYDGTHEAYADKDA